MSNGISTKVGAPEKPTSKDCEKLDEINDEARKEIVDKMGEEETKKAAAIADKADGTGMTVASVRSTVPGARGVMTTSSDGTANAAIPNQNCGATGADEDTKKKLSKQMKGLKREKRVSKQERYDKQKEEAGVLCDGSHVHPGGGKGAHSEAKAINCLTNMGSAMSGGSLTFNINWKSSTLERGDTSGMPCPDCYAMLCHAVTVCKIKVYICDHKDPSKPQPLSDKDCKDDDGYKNLSTRVDGHSTPGRA